MIILQEEDISVPFLASLYDHIKYLCINKHLHMYKFIICAYVSTVYSINICKYSPDDNELE